MFGDTIAAISTAWGDAGISVIRLSGSEAFEIAEKTVKTVCPFESTRARFMHNATLLDESGNPIDEVLIVRFDSPKSYTGEEIVEIHCHGGTLVAQRCLDRCLEAGARHAEPGEFTRRAYENGRLDLSQAEAVNGIIHARSNEALKAASRTLRGELSNYAREVYDEIMALSAEIEVAIDFPEEDVPFISVEEAADRMETLTEDLKDLLDRCSSGFLLREGIKIALVGRPNVGKSSLLNALLKESRAIVTAVPGTTRDVIEEVLTHRGVPLRLMDTAGLRETPADEVEAIGIERTDQAIEEADIRLWIIDGSEPLTDFDKQLAKKLIDKTHIIAINKSDLSSVVEMPDISRLLPDSPVFYISAEKGQGLEDLKEALVETLSGGGTLEAGLNASARQVNEIRQAILCLDEGRKSMKAQSDQTLAASFLAEARDALERLLGICEDDALLDVVFSKFCVGK